MEGERIGSVCAFVVSEDSSVFSVPLKSSES